MKKLLIILVTLIALAGSVQAQNDLHVNANDTGTAPIRVLKYPRSSDSTTVNMQLFQQGWQELNFGNTNNCAQTNGVCNSTSANQVFNEATTSQTSNVIPISGHAANTMATHLAVACECDDSDVDFNIRVGFETHHATAHILPGAVIPFDNTIGTITGFTTLESGFRPNGFAIVSVLGAQNIVLRLTINAGATPRVSCWFSRL